MISTTRANDTKNFDAKQITRTINKIATIEWYLKILSLFPTISSFNLSKLPAATPVRIFRCFNSLPKIFSVSYFSSLFVALGEGNHIPKLISCYVAVFDGIPRIF